MEHSDKQLEENIIRNSLCYETSGNYLAMGSFNCTHGNVALLDKNNIFIRATGKRTVLRGVVTNVSSDGFAVRAIETNRTTANTAILNDSELAQLTKFLISGAVAVVAEEKECEEAEKYLSLLSKKAEESLKKIDRMHKQNLKLFSKFEMLNEKAKKHDVIIDKYKRAL